MNKKQMTDKFLLLLYEIYKNKEDICANTSIKDFETEIGELALYEIIQELREKEWTKFNSLLGKGGGVTIIAGTPILSLDAIEYVKNLKKPLWKKITIKKIIRIIIYLGGLLWVILTQLIPNIDKIYKNLNYLIHFFK